MVNCFELKQKKTKKTSRTSYCLLS